MARVSTDDDARRLVTRRETRNDPPNLYVRNLDARTPDALKPPWATPPPGAAAIFATTHRLLI